MSDAKERAAYVRAVLECNFAGFQDEIIETAVIRITEYYNKAIAEVEPVKHGYWTRPYNSAYRECSVCKMVHYGLPWNARYCPFCGAKNEVKE